MISKIQGSSIFGTLRFGAMALVLVLAGSGPVLAGGAGTCALDLQLDYVGDGAPVLQDAPVRVRLTLGAGQIANGTTLTLKALRFFLQCNANASRLVPCAQDGFVAMYEGDQTISTTCAGVGWSSGHAASPRPNQVVFTPSEPIVIPAGSTNFCEVEFDVRVLAPSRDVTPNVIEQVVAVGFDRPDAVCDNGLRAAEAATSGITLAR
jgi:hypothetical protein